MTWFSYTGKWLVAMTNIITVVISHCSTLSIMLWDLNVARSVGSSTHLLTVYLLCTHLIRISTHFFIIPLPYAILPLFYSITNYQYS